MRNGSAEWFNQTLIKMLSTICEEQKCEWKSHVALLVHAYAYNGTKSDAWMDGCLDGILNCPFDVFFGIASDLEKGDHHAYVQKLRDRWK